MRKALVFFLATLSLSCALFRAKPVPYPIGVVFPLVVAGRVEIEGKVIGGLVREEADRILISTDRGFLYRLDIAAKAVSWRFENTAPFGCPPAPGPGGIFIWDEGNSVFCLDREGTILWQVKVSERISSPVSLDRENLYIGTEKGRLLALSQAGGELLWTYETEGPVSAAPVFFNNQVCVGSGDGRIHVLSPGGRLRGTIDVGSPILVTPLIDGRRLYVGSEDRSFGCYDLRKLKKNWSITAGGRLLAVPWADQKRVYFSASNGVLYALNKKSGHILWWWIAPSRSRYAIGFDGRKILATSASPELYSLDVRSGKTLGKYEAGEEIRSNPVWEEPYLLFALFDPSVNKGRVVFLRKEVAAKLSASPASPQPVGTEVSFTASATGFFRPRFEFTLVDGEEETLVQGASERSSWVWFSEKEGLFTVKVKVVDENQSQEAEIAYRIGKSEKQGVAGKRPEER